MAQGNLATDVIWPLVKRLLMATLQGDAEAARACLVPGGNAAEMVDLFGLVALDLLLKTVLNRDDVVLGRVVSTNEGSRLYAEFYWPDPGKPDAKPVFADSATVVIERDNATWRVADINPSTIEKWLTSPAARGLLAGLMEGNDGRVPDDLWVLPIAFMGGAVRLAFRPNALHDAVEETVLPGMQERGYGAPALVNARRLWRDYVAAAPPPDDDSAAWAAAVEYLMSVQSAIDTPQAFVGKQYGVSLSRVLPRIHAVRDRLDLAPIDERYTPIAGVNIVT